MALRKIAYLAPLYFDEESCLGGGERYPLNLAKGLVEHTAGLFEVELISFGERSLVRELAPGVNLRVLKVAGPARHPLDVLSWELPEALADADLVHIHQAYTRCSEMGMLVAKQQRKPLCVTDHGGESSTIGKHLGSLELADQIVAYSDFGASLYQTSRPIEVIKGGVDARTFTPSPRPVERDRVLYVGRLLPHKGIDQLIEALPSDLPLTVCGRPYHLPYYERLKELARGKLVEFVTDGDDAAIQDLYRRSWVNVLPSVYQDCYGQNYVAPELMGFTLLEAMCCATPAICSRVGAMPEFIRDGETGFIFDSREELGAQLSRLAADPALVDRMGRRARQVIEEEFDYLATGRKLQALYESMLARHWEQAA